MTIMSVGGGEGAVTLRYIPVLVWGFAALAAFGVSQIVARIVAGQVPDGPGPLIALAALIGFTLFVLSSGGQLVVASFDRATDTVRVRRYGLTGRRAEERRLSEVVGLDVRILRRAQHRIELRLRSGERLPLTSYYVVTFSTRGLSRLSDLLGLAPTVVVAAGKPGSLQ